MKVHNLLSCYSYFCKQNVFDGAIKLVCFRTTGPLFRTYEPSDYRTFITERCKSRYRTYEPSDYRTFITERCKSRYRTYEPSDCRTFGLKNPLFRTHEPSDYRTFGLESSHHNITVWVAFQRFHLTIILITSTAAQNNCTP